MTGGKQKRRIRETGSVLAVEFQKAAWRGWVFLRMIFAESTICYIFIPQNQDQLHSRPMKQSVLLFLITLLSISPFLQISSQEAVPGTITPAYNMVGGYVGMFDLNIHYERVCADGAGYQLNFRLGVGTYNNGKYAGYYTSPLLVFMAGRNSSHLELNAGLRLISDRQHDYSARNIIVKPEVYLGYRFDNLTQGLYFRVGVSSQTYFNAGLGYRIPSRRRG